MYPLWDLAIAPVIQAAAPARIVEIGALRGETTTQMIDALGAGVEVHVIDPDPDFDPGAHEARFAGQYVFHRAASLDVLPTLPAFDVALVDGDHNWYTVYHELRLLREAARAANVPLPVLIMHDVLWPYGRRDLYYDPSRIPEEFRQPFDTRGMVPGASELMSERAGGINPTMNNALTEGGGRNGVMTAFDDFLAEHDRPVRRVLIPIYFGLLIAVEEDRLATEPALVKALDELESAETRHDLLELSEELRIKALLLQHRVYYGTATRIDKLTGRYLSTLKDALLNEHYLENEVRLDHLEQCARQERPYDAAKLEDPGRNMRGEVARVEREHRRGTRITKGIRSTWLPYAPMGRTRLEHLERCLDDIRNDRVPGDVVSCNTSRGGDAIFAAGYLDAHDVNRRVWVAAPLRGPLPAAPGGEGDHSGDLNFVRDGFARFGLLDERIRFLQGDLLETLPDAPIRRVSLLRIEGPSPATTRTVLNTLYDRVEPGGWVIVDDFRNEQCVRVVEDFRARRGIDDPMERVEWSGLAWRKSAPAEESAPAAATPQEVRRRAPLAKRQPERAVDLSVVVVFYNMRREAERTLHSLSRAYQHGIDDLTYEVIAVENGSAREQELGREFVQSFGREFRYVNLRERATPSPVPALNHGMAIARGRNIAFMIDGAHVLTPGVLRYAMVGLAAHEPAMVVTQQWYLGPGQQPEAGLKGYDQEYEDRLLRQVRWPTDGYGLFRIGHFVGDRDWFDGLWESNCIFVPRRVLEQVGGFDESFSMAGGGYANLEFYERIGAHAGLSVVTILGEGSFHQVHGGTTTNQIDIEERNRQLLSYRDHYVETRGRHFTGHGKPIHYVGAMNESSRRTKARRMTSSEQFKSAARLGPDGFPEGPVPMPEELRVAFTDAFWHTLDWQQTSWLGHRVEKSPADLFAYQELVVRVRPEWIIETDTGPGGRALFFASLCDSIGHGRVLSIASDEDDARPRHERITYLCGDPLAEETIARVAEVVGPDPRALVVLGRDTRPRLTRAFDGYARFVPEGSYVVFEDTVTNGHPVWPGMGPGPNEASRNVTKTRADFRVDPLTETFGPTFNPGGFLKRVSSGG